MIHFVSYNTQFCTGLDGRTEVERIVSEVRGADVIALQEIDRFWTRTGNVDQAEEIARKLPDYFWAYGPGLDVDASFRSDDGRIVNRRRQFGNMVLARWPLLMVRNHLLPKLHLRTPMSLQRAALETVVALPDGPCRVVSVHLAHAAATERSVQIERLLSILRAAPVDGGAWSGRHYPEIWGLDGPPQTPPRRSIVMGDFNLEPACLEYVMLCGPIDPKHGSLSTADGLIDAWTIHGRGPADGAPSFVGEGGPQRLDYAFVTDEIAQHLDKVWIAEDATGSDHKPLWLAYNLGAGSEILEELP